MIVIKCPYCNAFIEDRGNNNFQGFDDYDVISCLSCNNNVSMLKVETSSSCYEGEQDIFDFNAIKADCMNGSFNHKMNGCHCLICKKDLTPTCLQEGNTHVFDEISHLCIHCNNVLDENFVRCQNGGKMHVFVSGQCHCLKLENCTEKEILEAQSKALEFKKVIGTLGQTMNFKSPEYKGLVGGLINQIKKIDKFLEANR